MRKPLSLLLLIHTSLLPLTVLADTVERPSLAIALGADSIILRQAYSSNSLTVTGSHLSKLAEEIAALDKHPWQRESIIKHGACGHSILIAQGSTTLLHLYVYPNKVYVAPYGTSRNPQFITRVSTTELSTLREALASLPPRSPCPNDA